MKKVSELSFIEYLQLDEEGQALNYEAVLMMNKWPVEIDCTQWRWGDVKKAQDLLTGTVSYRDMLEAVRIYAPTVNEYSDIRIVFRIFEALKVAIERITKIEGDAIASEELTAKVRAAIDAVGGFDRFGTLPQSLELVGFVAPSLIEVERMPWEVCFAAHVYKRTMADFKQKLYEK